MSKPDDKRVLMRKGARLLTEEESANTAGGFRTLTVCSFDYRTGSLDGDINECAV